jgi:hypothetical protein
MVHILYHKKSNVSYLAHLCTYVPFPLRDASGGNIATKIQLPQQLAGRPFPLTGRQWQLPANCLLPLRASKLGSIKIECLHTPKEDVPLREYKY